MKETEFLGKLRSKSKYGAKKFPKFLKYLGKIEDTSTYEKYIKENVKIPIIEWVILVLIIRPILLFAAIVCLSSGFLTPTALIFAEGISIVWYLLIELKQDLWRKNG
jgi:hypothetical protein